MSEALRARADGSITGMQVLEWWPDYAGSLLHLRAGRGGQPVDLARLGLSEDLLRRLRTWVDRYEDGRLPSADTGERGDPSWLTEGAQLLGEVRQELVTRYTVVVTEPWWGEPSTAE